MKRLLLAAMIGSSLASFAVYARDDRLTLKIQEALNAPTSQGKIGSDIRLFWSDQKFPTPIQTFAIVVANKKTNAFNKSNEEACEINLASAVIALQDRARSEGGNAVVNIHSYYKKEDFSSQTDYMCGSGTFAAGVALRGTIVKLP